MVTQLQLQQKNKFLHNHTDKPIFSSCPHATTNSTEVIALRYRDLVHPSTFFKYRVLVPYHLNFPSYMLFLGSQVNQAVDTVRTPYILGMSIIQCFTLGFWIITVTETARICFHSTNHPFHIANILLCQFYSIMCSVLGSQVAAVAETAKKLQFLNTSMPKQNHSSIPSV